MVSPVTLTPTPLFVRSSTSESVLRRTTVRLDVPPLLLGLDPAGLGRQGLLKLGPQEPDPLTTPPQPGSVNRERSFPPTELALPVLLASLLSPGATPSTSLGLALGIPNLTVLTLPLHASFLTSALGANPSRSLLEILKPTPLDLVKTSLRPPLPPLLRPRLLPFDELVVVPLPLPSYVERTNVVNSSYNVQCPIQTSSPTQAPSTTEPNTDKVGPEATLTRQDPP